MSASPMFWNSSSRPPAISGVRQLPIRPWPKWVGSTHSVVASVASPMWARFSATRAISDRKLCTTPLGAPVVPEVNRINAGSSSAEGPVPPSASGPAGSPTRTTGTSSPSPAKSPPPSTTAGFRKSTTLASSVSARPGLTQAAHAPVRHTAIRSAKNAGVPPWAITAWPPRPRPWARSRAARPAAARASSSAVQAVPPARSTMALVGSRARRIAQSAVSSCGLPTASSASASQSATAPRVMATMRVRRSWLGQPSSQTGGWNACCTPWITAGRSG